MACHFLLFYVYGFHGLVDVFGEAVESLLDLDSFVFPLRVGIGAFSVLEDAFSGFVKDLQQFLSAFDHEFHGEILALS